MPACTLTTHLFACMMQEGDTVALIDVPDQTFTDDFSKSLSA